MDRLLGWSSYVQTDPRNAEVELRKEVPLQAQERVSISLTAGHESAFFTSKRMIRRGVTGVSGRRIQWKSVPYSSIQAFSMELAGHWQTNDVVLRIWSKGGDPCTLTLQRGKVNSYDTHSLLSQGVLHADQWVHAQASSELFYPPAEEKSARPKRQTLHRTAEWLGFLNDDRPGALSTHEVDRHLKADPRVLEYDEQVEFVMKHGNGKNLTLLTSKRIILGNIRGWAGKRIEFVSVPWKSARLYEVEANAGGKKGNMALRVWTNIADLPVLLLDLPSYTDIVSVLECFSAKLLGVSVEDFFREAPLGDGRGWVGVDHAQWRAWMNQKAPTKSGQALNPRDQTSSQPSRGDGQGEAGADPGAPYRNEIDRRYHSEPRLLPILQHTEHVDLAMVSKMSIALLTTKRLIIIKAVPRRPDQATFLSIPWSSIQSFAVRSDGEVNAELSLWTDVTFEPKTFSSRSAPGKSYLRVPISLQQIQEITLHKYLSTRIMAFLLRPTQRPEPRLESTDEDLPNMVKVVTASVRSRDLREFVRGEGKFEGGAPAHPTRSMVAVTARAEVDVGVHAESSGATDGAESPFTHGAEMSGDVGALCAGLLEGDERIVLGFTTGQDSTDITCFTTKRALVIDRQESGPYEIVNIPWRTVRGFTVLVSNVAQAQVSVHLSTPWMPEFAFDLRGGTSDMLGIQRFLSAQLLGEQVQDLPQMPATKADASGSSATHESINRVVLWFLEDWQHVAPAEVESCLRTAPPILLAAETVDIALKVGSDMLVVTSRRLLQVKIIGRKEEKTVQFRSMPLSGCTAHAVQSAGTISWDAETTFETDVPSVPRIQQDLYKSKEEVRLLQGLMATSILPA